MKSLLKFFFATGRLALSAACFLFFALSSSGSAYAQDLIMMGPKVGGNLTTLAGKDAANASTDIRFMAGGFLSIKPNNQFAIQVEANYTQKGARVRNTILATSEIGLTYVEVPLLAKFSLSTSGKAIPYLATGPYAGFLLNARNTYLNDQTVTQQYKKVDFGWSAGGGLEMDLGNKWLMIDLRYTPGFVRLPEQKSSPAIRNSVFTLSMALGFELFDRYGNRRH
jgi:hypothetical protein